MIAILFWLQFIRMEVAKRMMCEQFLLDPKQQQPLIASYGQVTEVFERNSIPFVINWILLFIKLCTEPHLILYT